MMKLKLIFSYDGSSFLGSAMQIHKKSVQDALSEALSHLGIFSRVLMASRTDKGVHASYAVASVECGEYFKDFIYLQKQINKFAHPFIHIKKIERVKDDFEVRFDVKAREYRYIFSHARYNPFMSSYVYFYPRFDIIKANRLLKLFIGKKDLKFFCKSGGNYKTTIREIFSTKAYVYKDLSIFCFKANGFLRGQIRLSVASILKVLEGKMSEEELKEQIEGKKRYHHSLVPPNGLYLSRIFY
ncbi:tRNA pseudouridine(38-40) synthase TruA [Campylobacter hepaticus]|uniref:tRNA pseudouridine synthase A n=1 Tax=Campylobacter hepaticus TaxID=1813019 RepID=A0A6A7JR90_9BACT|nr:tRNA pseudouridine(38-40) synthase TruA [Campylobacter hepaticus]AXP08626.1 tRNA pseudouridine(38-40) synthase TruA [Campylobacter hepaticus]MCZ0772468.1 tRNA pseudouridine(38-40) synthase TruA [Campylobacter hepaticus]MCZ0773936.1 tRNA pseudouridine(38-40) synthase TruA [Campylobacter hepaticus]MCZ0775188.1 tRNA pseudouridine(38-40) synthase TruA [Campylobacter hepaticus]MDX2323310.1 tRNA pseudouridine(38-40) synthase TruA [Campylobacter hepaticus]